MIWGSQYDQVMKFVNGKKDGVNNNFNVTSYGEKNSKTTVHTKTGKNSKDVVANIYDLEGGRREWTQEANIAFSNILNHLKYNILGEFL